MWALGEVERREVDLFPSAAERVPSPAPTPAWHRAEHRPSAEGGSPGTATGNAFLLLVLVFFFKSFIQHNFKLSNAASVAGSERSPEVCLGFATAGLSLLHEGISSVLNLVQFQPYFSTPDC